MSMWNAEVDYGPLALLLGKWQGDKGKDVAPEPDDVERNDYYETILFEAAGLTTNAEEQELIAVRYHQLVARKTTDKIFHNQTGFWMWEPATGLIMQSLTIPRGICLLAGGKADESGKLQVRAAEDDPEWGVIQSPFMQKKARVTAFEHSMFVDREELVYEETTFLDIYGSAFDHTDANRLTRCS